MIYYREFMGSIVISLISIFSIRFYNCYYFENKSIAIQNKDTRSR